MKKMLLAFFAMLLIFTLAACGGNNSGGDSKLAKGSVSSSEKTEKMNAMLKLFKRVAILTLKQCNFEPPYDFRHAVVSLYFI